ncbi:MAG: GNAT family N-acyltransferase [Pseudomonadota bacterium]
MSAVRPQTGYARPSGALREAIDQTVGHYRVRLAGNDDELDAVFGLRFRVFNLELDEGLDASYKTARDEDQFDRQCHHLIVEDTRDRSIVGTYRMQDASMAQSGHGFYSQGEYELSRIQTTVLPHAIELGRACIDEAHRNTRVLFLLWRGLAAYMVAGGHRYFFGCCSLTSQHAGEGIALHRKLIDDDMVDQRYLVSTQPDYRCLWPDDALPDAPRIPKLMRLYLSYGARIISPPAIDREFSTIDYLALFDLESLSDAHRKLFLEPRP